MAETDYDLLIVGGGINGAGIARDAAGRGLTVLLVEADDLAGHTSSASTKLIHGGLRYLEYGEFRLVREALIERERLWGMAPHIIWPLRFVLPQTHSPRAAWMVRLGLFLYDHLGGRKRLPATETVGLAATPYGAGLRDTAGKAFVYSDCWVEDSRLVVLNARDAANRGATIATRTRLVQARREGEGERWVATIADAAGERMVSARVLVNAAGAWTAGAVLRGGDLPGGDFEAFVAALVRARQGLPATLLRRLARAYGTKVAAVLGDAQTMRDLGEDFGGGLTAREVDYLVAQEWARTAEDVLFRRSKLGLHVPDDTAARVAAYLREIGV